MRPPAQPLILSKRIGSLGVLSLNRPRALNAANLDMILSLQQILKKWNLWPDSKVDDDNNRITALLLKSSQKAASTSSDKPRPRVFCAGGDVKSIYQSIVDDSDMSQRVHGQGWPGLLTADFFRHEYEVNYALGHLHEQAEAKEGGCHQVSLWDGIVLGGGVGLSIHGQYRVATQHTSFGMPETAIGLFPDVGSMHWMPRLLRPGMAAYLALTGKRLNTADVLYAGLATHYVPSERLEALEKALVKASASATDENVVAPVLDSFHEAPPSDLDPNESFLAQNSAVIEDVFGESLKSGESNPNDRVEKIVAALEQLGADDAFGQETLQELQRMSPVSLKVTVEGLRRGSQSSLSLAEDLATEFRIGQGFMRQPYDGSEHCSSDFCEGIRAVLIDKDNRPQWHPPTLEQVTPELVESYFAPIEHEWQVPGL